ncbi:MAG: hypothetical protein KME26_03095 [Oscillatoria princeps RMCB-10]|nr:hypothetical protein [Oscillatoria princeps RMCB-10]
MHGLRDSSKNYLFIQRGAEQLSCGALALRKVPVLFIGGWPEIEMPAVLEISAVEPRKAGAGIRCWGWQQSTGTGRVPGGGAAFNPPAAKYLEI